MKSKVLTLGTIRDYILEHYPSILWWNGYHKHEKFNPSKNYKHRAGMPNEIRIEFDGEDYNNNWENINFTAIKLNNLGYSFAIYYVEGGRSPHIHIYDIDELEILSQEQREEYRKRFLSKICPKNSNPDYGLCDERHLMALEFANHFKYNKPKGLLSYYWNGRNQGIDNDIKIDILFGKKSKKITEDSNRNKKLKFGDFIRKKPADYVKGVLKFEKVLEKYGIKFKRHMALCPFHNDTNYSLSFSNEKGLWNCFGCPSKGDIITLIKLLKERKYGDKE